MGAIVSLGMSEKSRQEKKKAVKIQNKIRQTQDSRKRLAQIRESRMAQAQVLQSGATQGAIGSSAVQGGYSAIGSNAENNIQFINQIDTLQQAVNKRMEKAGNYANIANVSSEITNMAASAASGGG